MSTNDDVAEARRAAAMWESRYRESEQMREQDAAILRALRGEVERMRAAAPSADREAELDRIAATQRERMGTAAPVDDTPDPDVFHPDDEGDVVSPEDAERAALLVSLLHRSTAELRSLVVSAAQAADLDAARSAAREARERAEKATAGPWEAEENVILYVAPGVEVEPTWSIKSAADDDGIIDGGSALNEADAAFIAAARTDVPTLAAHVEALATETERLRARVAEQTAELSGLRARHYDTIRAFYETAPEAARALSKEQVDALSLDAMHGPEMAEKIRAAMRKKGNVSKTDPVDAVADELVALRARVAELEALKPAGHRVAALLAAVEARAAEAALDGGSFESGRSAGLEDAARFITAHLGAPSPLDGAVAEVLTFVPMDTHGTNVGADLSPAECADLAVRLLRAKGGRFPPTERSKLLMAARVLLLGIQACDAAAKGGPT